LPLAQVLERSIASKVRARGSHGLVAILSNPVRLLPGNLLCVIASRRNATRVILASECKQPPRWARDGPALVTELMNYKMSLAFLWIAALVGVIAATAG
jgi:hypothetical protein